MNEETKKCTKCGEIKTISEFHGIARKASACKTCACIYRREHMKDPTVKERAKEWAKKYRQDPTVKEHNRLLQIENARKHGVEPITRPGYKFSWEGVPAGMKRCTNCYLIKPLSDFESNKDCKFGVSSKCKICRWEERQIRARKKGRRSKYDLMVLIENVEGIPHKKCSRCKILKPLTDFRINPSAELIDGHDPQCKECTRKSARERRVCVKNLCKKLDHITIEKICPTCGNVFGVTKTHINQIYCCHRCYWDTLYLSRTERREYSLNLERIRKEQKL